MYIEIIKQRSIKNKRIMKRILYILKDETAIGYILNGELDALQDLADESKYGLDISEPYEFESESDAIAFGDALEAEYGTDERATPNVMVLDANTDAEALAIILG